MEFRILGPLEVVSEQTLLDLGAPRVRLLLALLLVRGGEVVSTDRLIEDLWDGDPPATSRHTMQGCVYRLRQALGVDAWRLATRPPGYQLKASADEVDARRFQELAQQGRDALAGGDRSWRPGCFRRRWRCGEGQPWPTCPTPRRWRVSGPGWRGCG